MMNNSKGKMAGGMPSGATDGSGVVGAVREIL